MGSMKKNNGIPDNWLIFLAILLFVYLTIKIIERSNLLFVFPFDYINDISSYMARLFFLAKYGFHATVPNWFNGQYVLFMFSGPGWYYFTLPLYYITKNVQTASYMSMIIIYLMGFAFFLILGKASKLSITKTIAFYLIFFANPMATGNFIRLGKLPELFGWVIFTLLFALIAFYKDKRLDKKILWIIPLYAAILLTSTSVFIPATLIIFSLFMIKTSKEKAIIALTVVGVAIITAFWWYPYITNASMFYAGQRAEMEGFLFEPFYLLGDTIASFVIMPAFFLITYFYLKSKNYMKKEIMFLLPSIILGLLFFTRVIVFIPILNKPHPDSYTFYFLFMGMYLFLKTNFREYPKVLGKIIKALLIILPVVMIVISQLSIPKYVDNTEEDRETIQMMSYVGNSGTLVIFGAKSYTPAYYSYGSIHSDIRTTGGYSIEEMEVGYLNQVRSMERSFNEKDCGFMEKAKELKLDYVVTYNEQCNFLKSCGAGETKRINKTCLYKVDLISQLS